MSHSDGSVRNVNKAWLDFIEFCRKLDHGEICSLKVQDGQPVIAEMVRVKVRFPVDR